MRILRWLFGAIAVLALLVVVGGLLLPATFRVTRSATVQASPERVYALLASPREWKRWSAWNQRDPGMEIRYSGPESGPGAVWEWKSRSEGDGRMTFTAAEPGRRVAYDLFFPDFGTTSTGDFTLAPEGGGTRVTWTMNGHIGSNPVFRWMGLFADGMVGKDFEAGLAGLKAVAEKP